MGKVVVLEPGTKFGRLTVTGRATRRRGRCIMWNCDCECGGKTADTAHCLRQRPHPSCGCLKGPRQHGHTIDRQTTKVYKIWQGMKARCSRATSDHSGRYHGRGIKVCERWAVSFEDFLADILAEIGQPPSAKHQIDRKDNDGHYEPGNVRWATREQQQRNTRRTHLITYKGKTQCLTDWAIELGIPRPRLSRRIHLGWSITRAFSCP